MFLNDVWRGLAAYMAAIKLLTRQGWWKYTLAPGFVSLIFGVVVLTAAWGLSDNMSAALMRGYPFEQGKAAAAVLVTLLSSLLIIAIGIIIFKNLVMLLVSPWMNRLSIKIERHTTGHSYIDERTFVEAFRRQLRLNLRLILREAAFIILIFLFGLIPVLDFAVPPLLFLVQSFYAGFGNLDYFMDRHYTFAESVAFVKRNKGVALGNGIGFLLLLLIPVAGVFLAPTLGVAAATLSGISLQKKEIAQN